MPILCEHTEGPLKGQRFEMDESALEKREGHDHEQSSQNYAQKSHAHWVEYWLDGKMVHRSVHVTLKFI